MLQHTRRTAAAVEFRLRRDLNKREREAAALKRENAQLRETNAELRAALDALSRKVEELAA